MKSFHIVFSIYWLYQRILNFLHRHFINTLTDSVQNVVRKSAVTKFNRWSDGVCGGDDNNSNNITYYYLINNNNCIAETC